MISFQENKFIRVATFSHHTSKGEKQEGLEITWEGDAQVGATLSEVPSPKRVTHTHSGFFLEYTNTPQTATPTHHTHYSFLLHHLL